MHLFSARKLESVPILVCSAQCKCNFTSVSPAMNNTSIRRAAADMDHNWHDTCTRVDLINEDDRTVAHSATHMCPHMYVCLPNDYI